MEAELTQHPHRRFNPLSGEWILVSPHRALRPWLGQREEAVIEPRPGYDPNCYLCPGNLRAEGERNPKYSGTFVFENDFPALKPDTPLLERNVDDLLIAKGERGCCRVVCFTPKHDLSLASMDRASLRGVVDVWAREYVTLGSLSYVNSVIIFENRGEMMGTSNPHPHCQIWANSTIPGEPRKELACFEGYMKRHGCCLLCRYLELELELGQRVVFENEDFVAMVPFWAVWPFETLVLSRRHLAGMDELCSSEREMLADCLKQLTLRYDQLFETLFPYSMGFHQRPTDGDTHKSWHFHAHFYPPLLRSASVRKFMVGYEMLGNPQRDITAEMAAQRLRSLAESTR